MDIAIPPQSGVVPPVNTVANDANSHTIPSKTGVSVSDEKVQTRSDTSAAKAQDGTGISSDETPPVTYETELPEPNIAQISPPVITETRHRRSGRVSKVPLQYDAASGTWK